MDPISVAASIVGLMGAASKISETLIKLIRSARSVSKLAQELLSEISNISASLRLLQRYLVDNQAVPRSNGNLLSIEDIVITLSNCVMVFSELEKVFDSLKPMRPLRPGRVIQWLWKEHDIQQLLNRLKSSQMSLNLMLTTMTW